MNRKKNLLRIGIVVALMIVGAVIAFVLLPKIYRTEGATQTVAALNCDVTKGTQIQETMVITKAVGAYGLDSSVVTDPSQIIGLYHGHEKCKRTQCKYCSCHGFCYEAFPWNSRTAISALSA